MTDLSDLILNWYQHNARVLPWRGLSDPYAIWVSEIMLQQTKVETVIPFFEKWMKQFPAIDNLAIASEQTVLSAWEGLGYYSRVRNFHKAAKVIMEECGGRIPSDFNSLIKLPGIGRYTAAAISSIAFDEDIGALDGNIRRVYARVFDISQPVEKPEIQQKMWNIAQDNLPTGRAGDYNQALMDLGAAICTPRKPHCDVCPLKAVCQSIDNPESRPVLKHKQKVPHKNKTAAVIINNEQVLLHLRPSNGLLGGMWEFPAVEIDELDSEGTEKFEEKINLSYKIGIISGKIIMEVHHAYTHFTLSETARICSLVDERKIGILAWIKISDLMNKPMGKVDRIISQKVKSE